MSPETTIVWHEVCSQSNPPHHAVYPADCLLTLQCSLTDIVQVAPSSSTGRSDDGSCFTASSQGDVRSSPMAYPAVRSLPKLPLPLRPEAEYLIVGLLVRPVGHQAQSLAIALRSPATKRSSDLNRYSPDIHAHYALKCTGSAPPHRRQQQHQSGTSCSVGVDNVIGGSRWRRRRR